ncbi:MAG: coproporphyrinogen III oxidase family protein, partial [Ignavibacteriaceae bacterium]|nr:coproporphyrinogen III oxidase family protein [Ignavibacteriaceae bacterium]
ISAGVQSFHEDDLKFLTRIHNRQTAIDTVHNVIAAGIDNINIDLIFNLPGQTKKQWLQNLEQAVNLPVKHISAYSLILERGTILNKMVLNGEVEIQDEDYDAGLYKITIDFLEQHGFRQYEVSNFAKPGFECRHNNAYWQYHEYISFGPSAHSFANNKRWWNFSSLKKYINEIKTCRYACAGFEELSDEQKLDEYVMLALRSSGINIKELKNNFGDGWLNDKNYYIKTLADENFLIYDEERIKLTKKGYAVCDEILSKIL